MPLLIDMYVAGFAVMMLKAILCYSVLCLLLAISLTDYDTMTIPDRLNVALLACGVLAAFIVPEISLASRLVGLFCVSVPLLIISCVAPGAFGGGDVKLMAAAGFLLGWQSVLVAAVIGFIVGGAYGVCLLLSGRKATSEHFAFGPALCLGIMVALFFGQTIAAGYVAML